MARESRSRERLLQEMRRAAARGHRVELETGTVTLGRSIRPAVRAVCRCGWSSRWKASKPQALASVAWHVGQVGAEDPLWDPVLEAAPAPTGDGEPGPDGTVADTPDMAKIPRTVGGSL